jgi:succinate dehydrogenase flavin-adding protein (antitoxin of CptAB toxin-antitoxin module)
VRRDAALPLLEGLCLRLVPKQNKDQQVKINKSRSTSQDQQSRIKRAVVDEQRSNRLRRLVYQASYTGMKETDLLLGHFAKAHLPGLSDRQLDDFEALLAAGDDRIHAWVMESEPLPDAYDTDVFHLIKNFK